MNTTVRVLRGIFTLAIVVVGGFFAWWTAVIWGNIGDRGADNTGFTYFVVGLLPALLAALCLGLAVVTVRGEKTRFAWFAAAALAVPSISTLSGIFR